MPNADARRFLTRATGAALGLVALAGAVNVLVDPYDVFRYARIPGVNIDKPAIESQVRLAKAYQIRRLKPEIMVLGNSRVEMGLDTERRSREIGKQIFNGGLPGSTIYELHRYLQHAAAIGSLEEVLIALDIFSFNTQLPAAQNDFLESRLMMRADNRPTPLWDEARINDLFNLVLAWPTVERSIDTVLRQGTPGVPTRTPTGFDPLDERSFLAAAETYADAFRRKDRNYFRRGLSRGMSLAPSAHWPDGSMIELVRILDFCREKNIKLTLFIHPYHAHVLEILALAGQWEIYEDWKRQVTAVVAADAARHPDKAPVPLWDFGYYNAVTTEPVPPREGEQRMTYYWDSAHYKSTTGRAIGERMLDFGIEPQLPDFGVLLTPQNIESHLQRTRTDRARYRLERWNEVELLQGMQR